MKFERKGYDDKAKIISLATWYYQVWKSVRVREYKDEGSKIRVPQAFIEAIFKHKKFQPNFKMLNDKKYRSFDQIFLYC